MSVDWQRPEFQDAIQDWQLVDDVLAGERTIKEAGESYLPKPNPQDVSPENALRYEQYTKRAVFYPVTGRTQKGLCAVVFRKEPVLEIPPALEYVTEDVDGENNSIYQHSQKSLDKTLGRGRHGLLVDYPQTEGETSKAEKEAKKIRATIVKVEATQITNWRFEKIGGSQQLTLLVIKETYTENEEFKQEVKDQFRVLTLIEGVYTVQIWRKSESQDFKNQWVVVDMYQPTDGMGSTWEIIPFQFIGSESNDESIDEPPLLGLARLNVAHYRNSADYEDSAYFCGQPQPWMAGLDEGWRDWLQEQGVYVGSRQMLPLPVGGSFGLEQAQPNTLVKEAMDTKEQQMVSLGAHLVEKGSAVKTATQQDSEDAVSHSVVSLCASNISEAYTQALKWVARFENAPEENISYELNQEFTALTADPQMIQAIVGSWQANALPKSDMISYLKKIAVIEADRTDEEIDEELTNENNNVLQLSEVQSLLNPAQVEQD